MEMKGDNLLGIIGGIALGFFGARLLGQGTSPGIPADIEAQAARIVAFDDLSQVFLQRRPLYSYQHGGLKAALYAWTITSQEKDATGRPMEDDNPQIVMSVTPTGAGHCQYEFGGHGPTVSVYCDGEFRLTVPGSVGFAA